MHWHFWLQQDKQQASLNSSIRRDKKAFQHVKFVQLRECLDVDDMHGAWNTRRDVAGAYKIQGKGSSAKAIKKEAWGAFVHVLFMLFQPSRTLSIFHFLLTNKKLFNSL
eukprot:gnl/MRDRNA2_/MRDRNA2_17276_c0_seq1.p1 gnl/MRDRNA2_/MRDRNA2_17276_c0~~gnl/MRDRNA2_/MRDRNA2_17276_c0_seq1.p1  ORF type:complete len:109 (-),score=21.88 gnl/MRDRNA2_/MRDRNA2_17276_c0_seq1:12-338(-)